MAKKDDKGKDKDSKDGKDSKTSDDGINLNLIYHNYDAVLKDSFTLYKNDLIDFLGIDMPEVTASLNTERVEIKAEKTFSDVLLKLVNNTGVSIEWEVDISKADMIRFAKYCIDFTVIHGIPFITIILTNKMQTILSYKEGSIAFTPIVINLGERDGELALQKIRERIAEGKKVNLLELVYLPLYGNKDKEVVDVVKEVVDLIMSLTDMKEHEVEKLVLLSLVVAKKLITDDEFKEIWREKQMQIMELPLIRIAREEAKEEARKEASAL